MTEVLENRHWSGDGPFTRRCTDFLNNLLSGPRSLITPSGTAALEICAILGNLSPGDEVIMPSYTFSSTANAFVLRGAVPVFVDIREDTLNIDENLIEQAITGKTRAVCVVHYAGVACEMNKIKQLCKRKNLLLIEDAAHAIGASYKNIPLGSIGDLNAFSFHETKNMSSGEGGAFCCSNSSLFQRAEIIREKGTNRSQFFRGQVDKYRWVDLGSSFLPSEFQAAVLWSELEFYEQIQADRMRVWNLYHDALLTLEQKELLRRPFIPEDCSHNAHLYYILLKDLDERTALMDYLHKNDVMAYFHYVPLHSSPAGQKFTKPGSPMTVTDHISDRLLRLPFWAALPDEQIMFVVEKIAEFFSTRKLASTHCIRAADD